MKNTKALRSIKICVYFIIFATVLLSLGASVATSAENVMVISSKDVSVSSLDKEEIKQIFLGRKTRWPDDRKIKFVILKNGDTHSEFLKTYLHKTPSQFRTFWKKMIFTGKGRAPKSFSSPDELLDYVANTPGAIGYIPAEKKSENVNIIVTN